MSEPASVHETIQDEVGDVLIGNDDAIEQLTIALLTRGHVLMEGVPGVAKTTIARLFAQATGLAYSRIQMTPDTLPADITGTTVYREQTGEFEVQKGPVFANVVVADEINRATPKTQSALLEAMQEETVTIEGETHDLPTPFIVVATQNPIEMEGTFELPEAQRDRFQFKIDIDLLDRDDETELIDQFNTTPELGPDDVESVVDPEDLLAARETVTDQYVADEVRDYLLNIAAETRGRSEIEHGASHRAVIMLLNASKARAAIHGRDYVIPDDIKALTKPLLIHRLVLSTDASLSDIDAEDVLEDILDSVVPPSAEAVADVDSETDSSAAISDGGATDDNAGNDTAVETGEAAEAGETTDTDGMDDNQ
ncbi:AAA family ATPase [Halorientalis marina]|uniref:AAA family ATPase n=1 Tax=Halorientalis marina TaxID=2931976 RepID=UPI001FF3A6D0|nr:MoxR family ATPase [Halorientalis marina]